MQCGTLSPPTVDGDVLIETDRIKAGTSDVHDTVLALYDDCQATALLDCDGVYLPAGACGLYMCSCGSDQQVHVFACVCLCLLVCRMCVQITEGPVGSPASQRRSRAYSRLLPKATTMYFL